MARISPSSTRVQVAPASSVRYKPSDATAAYTCSGSLRQPTIVSTTPLGSACPIDSHSPRSPRQTARPRWVPAYSRMSPDIVPSLGKFAPLLSNLRLPAVWSLDVYDPPAARGPHRPLHQSEIHREVMFPSRGSTSAPSSHSPGGMPAMARQIASFSCVAACLTTSWTRATNP